MGGLLTPVLTFAGWAIWSPLVITGLLIGISVILSARKDKKLMEAGLMDRSGYGLTLWGRMLATMSLAIWTLINLGLFAAVVYYHSTDY